MGKVKILAILVFTAFLIGGVFWLSPWSSKIKEDELTASEEAHDHGHDHNHDHNHEESHIVMDEEQIQHLDISLREAGPGELFMTLATSGKIIIHPNCLVHILPKVSGVAKETKKNIGDHVKPGEVIAVLESRDMADLKAGYLAAVEKQNLAWMHFDRESRLYQKKISTEQEFLNAQSAYEEARISRQLATQKLKAFGLSDEEIANYPDQNAPNLCLYEIRSPMEGQIINRDITKGEMIENSTTIYEICNLSKVWLEIGIYPKDILKVSEGQTVEVTFPCEKLTSTAKIIYVSPIIQDETITAKAVAELANPEKKWRPGSFVKVNIATEKFTAPIVIPKEAVETIEGTNVVFIKTLEGFEKRVVKVGRSDDNNLEIVSGLNQGDVYAGSKTFLLKADLGKSSVEHED